MKLIHNVAAKLSLALLPVITMWALLFYFVMVNEINDEADDLLQVVSEEIMARELSGEKIPLSDLASETRFTVSEISREQFGRRRGMEYYDGVYRLDDGEETEPARFLRTCFMDAEGRYFEVVVHTPTFEKDELLKTILLWLLVLYLVLVLTVIVIALAVMQKSMKPLYSILGWLESYIPGNGVKPLETGTEVSEFKQLEKTVAEAVVRSDNAFEQQKQFIGNASHELQTPLAILAGRIDWLLNDESLSEEQARELYGMSRDVDSLSRLNRTLLLISRIDNGQFPELDDICPDTLIREYIGVYEEVFSSKEIDMEYVPAEGTFTVCMNETLAGILISNLIRNAYIHTEHGGSIRMRLNGSGFSVMNSGTAALDGERIFDRFYQGSKKEGSTGLGLALCKTIADRYSMPLEYSFRDGMHCFSLVF